MAFTYNKIANVTVTASTAAAIEFTSIPADYTDLVIKISARSTQNIGIAGLDLQYNGSSSNLAYRRLLGDGNTAAGANGTIGQIAIFQGGNSTTSTFGNYEVYIPNYRGNTNKSASADSVNETNATTEYAVLYSHIWSSTAAITSIKLIPSSGSIVQHSSAVLYGIKRA